MWRAGDENALLLPTLVLKLTLASRASIVTVGNTISCFRMFFSLASLVPDTQSWRVHPDFTSYICNMVEIIRQSEDVTFPDQISPLGRVESGTSLLRTFVVWTQLYWYFHIPTDHCRILQGMLTRLKDISIQLLHKCFHNEVAHVTLHTPTWLVFPEQWTTLRLLRVTEASLVIHHLTTAYSNSLYLTSVLFNCICLFVQHALRWLPLQFSSLHLHILSRWRSQWDCCYGCFCITYGWVTVITSLETGAQCTSLSPRTEFCEDSYQRLWGTCNLLEA